MAVAILTARLANIYRDSKLRPEPFSPKEFMVDWSVMLETESAEPEDEDGGEGMSPEQIIAAFDRIIERQERRLKNGGG